MKVYIVTRGEYSSYRIFRVFLDKAKAEKFIETCSTDHYDGSLCLEEYESDDDTIRYDELGWCVTRYTGDRRFERGKHKEDEVWWDVEFVGTGKEEDYEYPHCLSGEWATWKEESGRETYTFYILAPSKEAALKIASERYMVVKVASENGWTFKDEVYYDFPGMKKIKGD